MSRYTGPRVRILRRLGMDLPGLTAKSGSKRAFPPGDKGPMGARKKKTDYGNHLFEYQKLRVNYGLSEKQFRMVVKEAKRQKGDSGSNLLRLLEQRLDNVVFRMGVGRSIPHARQVVAHGHVKINGRRVDIPSFIVKQGMELTLTDKIKANEIVSETLKSPMLVRPSYLSFDPVNSSATMIELPAREDTPIEVQEALVIEFYSRQI